MCGCITYVAIAAAQVPDVTPDRQSSTDQAAPHDSPEPQPTSVVEPTIDTAPDPAAQQPMAAALPVELQPYHVRIRIDFETALRLGEEFRRLVLTAVHDSLERYVGQFWLTEVTEENGTTFSGTAGLKRLRADTVPSGAADEDVQKVYLLSVASSGGGFRVAGREWDAATRQLGPLAASEIVYDRRELTETFLRVVHDLFRPVAVVEQQKSGAVLLRARGGDLPPPDEDWQPLRPGKLFESYYGFLNKDKAVDRIQQVPWTYLTTGEEVRPGVAECTVTSGLRSPLTSRRRIQTLALGINRRAAATRLSLVTRPPSSRPLAGVEVEISPVQNPVEDKGTGEKTGDAATLPRLVANRNGVVVVNSDAAPSGQPVWLLVRSGQALLARVPFVPGVRDIEVLELPDDSLRLETEGSVALLQAELVDTVARRAVLISLAKSRAKDNQWAAVDDLLKQLGAMPRAQNFLGKLNAIRIPARQTARARRDRTTELRIDKLCDETAELVTNYLDEEKLTELREELAELRQVAEEQAKLDADIKAGLDPAQADKKASTKKKTTKKSAPEPVKPPAGS